MQKQHRCVKQDAMLHSATGHSIAAIDAAFERGKLRIQERLDEKIRRSQAAAARLNRRLEEMCVLTKSAEDDHIKSKIGAALSQKDVRALKQPILRGVYSSSNQYSRLFCTTFDHISDP
jgi:hypothetical protein